MFYEQENEDAFLHQSTWRDNRFLDADYYKRTQSGDATKVSIYDRGEWAELATQIYSKFKIKPWKAAKLKKIIEARALQGFHNF